jgi:hypothetical protein
MADADFGFNLNGYLPTHYFYGKSEKDKSFSEIEENYFKIAQKHDVVVDRLPYKQKGIPHEGYCPKVILKNGEIADIDWTDWDNRFGKYLDGSFSDENKPIKYLILPVNENWPMPIDDYFNAVYTSTQYPEMVNQVRLNAGELKDSFKPGYVKGIKKYLELFVEHAKENKWEQTKFIFYLNNKHYYKDKNNKKMWVNGRYEGGSSWWCLDEPVLYDDYQALAFYADIFSEAKSELDAGDMLQFRVDISRLHISPKFMDEKMEILCVNRKIFSKRNTQAIEWKKKHQGEVWVYGHLSDIDRPYTDVIANIMDIYFNDGDVFLPWNNYVADGAYIKPETTASFYPGKRFDSLMPVASTRIKAARKGMQIIKLISKIKEKYSYTKDDIKQYVSQFVSIQGESKMSYDEDAGTAVYEYINPDNFELLRMDMLKKLGGLNESAN